MAEALGYVVMRQRREDPPALYWLAMFTRADADEKVSQATAGDPGSRYFVAAIVEVTDG